MEAEIWKDVPEYEGIYQVSNLLNFKKISGKRTGAKKTWLLNDGYHHIELRKNGKRKHHTAHRVMLMAFKGMPHRNMEALHIDGNSLNNSLDNLKWGTHKENMEDKIKHGVNKGPENYKGSFNPAAKINEYDVIKIKALRKKGLSAIKIAKMFNLHFGSIQGIVSGRRWKHVA